MKKKYIHPTIHLITMDNVILQTESRQIPVHKPDTDPSDFIDNEDDVL